MFGYVLPDTNYLYVKDLTLYRSVYCGICKSAKELFGNLPRLATNYDSVFLSVLVHNLADADYTVKRQNCILHPFRKRPIALPDELSRKIAALNVLLLYHKLTDDVTDGGGLKYRLARSAFSRAYRKAKRLHPDFDAIITEQYARLRELEKEGCGSLDRVTDCFALMMQKLCACLTGSDDPELLRLCYNSGRWIYLIDALDDLEKDFKSGNYNAYIAAFGGFTTRGEFVEANREELEFSLLATSGAISESAGKLDYRFNADLIRNITDRGLASRTKFLMENGCKCKKIRI